MSECVQRVNAHVIAACAEGANDMLGKVSTGIVVGKKRKQAHLSKRADGHELSERQW